MLPRGVRTLFVALMATVAIACARPRPLHVAQDAGHEQTRAPRRTDATIGVELRGGPRAIHAGRPRRDLDPGAQLAIVGAGVEARAPERRAVRVAWWSAPEREGRSAVVARARDPPRSLAR